MFDKRKYLVKRANRKKGEYDIYLNMDKWINKKREHPY